MSSTQFSPHKTLPCGRSSSKLAVLNRREDLALGDTLDALEEGTGAAHGGWQHEWLLHCLG